jgi:hypothetical protein
MTISGALAALRTNGPASNASARGFAASGQTRPRRADRLDEKCQLGVDRRVHVVVGIGHEGRNVVSRGGVACVSQLLHGSQPPSHRDDGGFG